MLWKVPRMWEGGTCFILGGGPSLLKQFNVPESVIQDVYTGKLKPSAYSPYLELIHKQHVIAVNVAYKIGPWIDMMVFGDDSTWEEEKEELKDFPGLIVSCAEGIRRDVKGLKMLLRDPRRSTGLSLNPSLIKWNTNSGAAAINVAVHTGVKRIVLLGFDMKLDAGDNQHWHKLYTSPVAHVQTIFNKHLIGFPQMKLVLDHIGVEVLNCNPDSAIEEFKKINFKDLKL